MFLLQFNSDQSLQHDCSDDPNVLSLIDIQCCGEVFAPLPEWANLSHLNVTDRQRVLNYNFVY